jgi:hypothetical protein
MTRRWNKVFGIGLSKTGTTSLASALEILGLKVEDYPSDPHTLQQLEQGDYDLKILEQADAMTDTPAALCYQQLDQRYPNSLFILTERKDQERWLRSAEKQWSFTEEWVKHDPDFARFVYFMNVSIYGVLRFSKERFRQVYERHAREVREYFSSRGNDLLVFDATSGDGWAKLCEFLNLPEPSVPYPHANSQEEKIDRYAWMKNLDQLYAIFQSSIPDGDKLILVDDQKLANTQIYHRWKCLPIACDRETYGGPPADSRRAIADTKKHIGDGANYLAIASTSFWWFDTYPEWSAWLSSRYVLSHTDDMCRVYCLRDC